VSKCGIYEMCWVAEFVRAVVRCWNVRDVLECWKVKDVLTQECMRCAGIVECESYRNTGM
jgi:hypothetical protein